MAIALVSMINKSKTTVTTMAAINPVTNPVELNFAADVVDA